MAKRKRTSGRTAEAPFCSCLLLCDDVVVTHARGGKHSLQGVISQLMFLDMPAVAGGHVVYMRLTNVYPNSHVTVSFSHADDDEKLWEFRAEILPNAQPLGIQTMIVNVPPFEISRPGRYILRANHFEIPIAQTPVMVHTAGRPTASRGDDEADR